MARRAPRRPGSFGPQWLSRRLRELLPQFPQVRLCLAYSGGADSSALLAALAALPRAPLALRAVYVDHGLHPHAARWGRHCRRVALTLGVSCTVRRARIERSRGESLEAAARRARYALLASALQSGEVLLTAHHQDDQLETVLLQLMRGAGLAGLSAMPSCAPLGRGLLVRPLLEMPRAQLRAWADAKKLSWVEDDSNAQLHLDRNYLRRQVLPLIHARWPAAAVTVARSARHAAEAQQLLDALAAADLAPARHGRQLSAGALRALPPARRRNALRLWISAAGARPPPSRRLAEISGALLSARADAQPFVAWEDARVQRHADLLSLHLAGARAAQARGTRERRVQAPAAWSLKWQWRAARSCPVPPPGARLSLRPDARGPVDLDALGASLQVRGRRGGEWLRPVRGAPRRSLKRLLQEARVPPALRAQLPLLFDGGRLIAAADLWLDESVQARAGSRHRARLIWRHAG